MKPKNLDTNFVPPRTVEIDPNEPPPTIIVKGYGHRYDLAVKGREKRLRLENYRKEK